VLHVVVEIAPASFMGLLPPSSWQWGSKFTWNIGKLLPYYMALHPRWLWSSFWKHYVKNIFLKICLLMWVWDVLSACLLTCV